MDKQSQEGAKNPLSPTYDDLKMVSEKQHDLLARSAKEIEMLRNINWEYSIRLLMFEDCMSLFRSEPPRYGMESTNNDILYAIKTHLQTK